MTGNIHADVGIYGVAAGVGVEGERIHASHSTPTLPLPQPFIAAKQSRLALVPRSG